MDLRSFCFLWLDLSTHAKKQAVLEREVFTIFRNYMQHWFSKVKPGARVESPAGRKAKLTRGTLWCLLLAFVAAFAVYVNSLPNAFVHDDRYYIEYHPLLSVETSGLLTSDFLGFGKSARYRPLTLLSFRANYILGGFDPFGYRLVNILLHAANTGLVYLLVLFLIKSNTAAFLTALLFAVHPIHTEAVAWVSGRAELLAAFFLFLSWLSYLKATRKGAADRCGVSFSLLTFFMALFAKEHAVTFPSVLVLSDVYLYFREGPPSIRPRELAGQLALRTRLYACYIGLIALYLLLRHLAIEKPFLIAGIKNFQVSNPLLTADLFTRIFTGLKVLGYYMELLVWPRYLSVDYSYNQISLETSVTAFTVLWPLAFLALLLVAGLWFLRRAPDLGFALLFFGVTVVPVSNIVIPIGTIMGERLLYFPSLGAFLFAACLWVRFLNWSGSTNIMKVAGYALLGGMLLLLSYRTVQRNKDWKNELELWQSALEVSPKSVKVRQNLAVALLDHGQRQAAMDQFREALRIYPFYTETYLKMGTLYAREGNLDKAIEIYREAARLMEKPSIYLNLGAALMRKGALDEAIGVYRTAVESVKESRLYLNLGVALMHKGKIDEAIESYEQATRLNPELAVAYYNLGNAYMRQNELARAIEAYHKAIELDADYQHAYNNLAYAYKQQGETDLAAQALRAAQRVRRRVGGSGARITHEPFP